MALGFAACNSDDDNSSSNYWSKYRDWREINNDYFQRMRDSIGPDGRLFYQVVFPKWNPAAEILVHFYNDRTLTEGNLTPMLTSTCDVRYYGQLYNGTPFDSSYNSVNAVRRFKPSQTIEGWSIALQQMRVGDTCEVIIPYSLGYGATMSRDGVILPYSALRFNLKLVDIPYYEIQP